MGIKCFAVVRGTTNRRTCELLTGTGTSLRNGTTTTVFVWPLPPKTVTNNAKMLCFYGRADSADDSLFSPYPVLAKASRI